MAGTLHLVGTPIGNLGDVTARAVEVLRRVAFVVCEDTRHSGPWLRSLGVGAPLLSLPAFAEKERARAILERLESGEEGALVTDAGSPGISDPGEFLVSEALARGVPVVPVPGPSALIAALSASGLPSGRFHFAGFLPRGASDGAAVLEELAALRATLVFYESARRLGETLAVLHQMLGDRRAVVARELTKVHEEFVRGTLGELAARYAGAPPLGEVVLLVEGRSEAPRWTEAEVRAALEAGLQRGERLKALSTEVARQAGWTGARRLPAGAQGPALSVFQLVPAADARTAGDSPGDRRGHQRIEPGDLRGEGGTVGRREEDLLRGLHLERVEDPVGGVHQLVVEVGSEAVPAVPAVGDDLAAGDLRADLERARQLREVEEERPPVRSSGLGDLQAVAVARGRTSSSG